MRKKLIAAVIGTSAISTVAAVSDAEAATYRVQAGDSLWSIATKHQISIAQLKSYNNLNSNLIFPNQVLKVSGGSTTVRQTNQTNNVTSNTYTVRSGDSLAAIAARYGTTYQNIMRLNGLNNFWIYPGQQLRVSGTATTNQTTSSQNTANTASNSSYYTVQPGDSLGLIASKYGTTYQNIMNLNGLSGFLIFPGQKLKVTGTGMGAQTQTPTTATTTYGSTSTFNHSNLYDWGQCTWHVFNKRQAAGRAISTYWWNANVWDDNAVRDGYTVNYQPAVGAILQSDLGYYGHVAYVERINGDGSVLVSEMNYSAGPGVLTYRTIPSYSANSFKYIH